MSQRFILYFYWACLAIICGFVVLLIFDNSGFDNINNLQYPDYYYTTSRSFLTAEDYSNKLTQNTSIIGEILTNTRSRIKYELRGYNFSYSGVQSLNDLLIEKGKQPLRTLVITTWRSGSSFLGEILSALPGNFYHYEPLLNYGVVTVRGPPESDRAINTVKNLFNCNYDNMSDYFEYGKKIDQLIFSQNKPLWNYCKHNIDLCVDANFSASFCKLFPFQLMKLTRLRLHLIQELLDDDELNLKIILLVRDPRAVLQSRLHRSWCPRAPDCSQPDRLCSDMLSNYAAASKLSHLYPGRIKVIRYEELALNPNFTAHELYKFLKLSWMPSVDRFLASHTNFNRDGDDALSTFRVSRERAFRWKKLLSFEFVERIQEVCREPMWLWGYQLAHNETHFQSDEFISVVRYYL